VLFELRGLMLPNDAVPRSLELLDRLRRPSWNPAQGSSIAASWDSCGLPAPL